MAKRDGLTAATILALTTCALPLGVAAQTASGYQKPPAAIEELLDSPKIPTASISPDRKMLLVEQPATFPTIADVAQPRYRLAGLRFSPEDQQPRRGKSCRLVQHSPLAAVGPRPSAACLQTPSSPTPSGRRTPNTSPSRNARTSVPPASPLACSSGSLMLLRRTRIVLAR